VTANGIGAEVHVEGLRKTYGSVVAVDDATLDIAAGEFVALLGPSGSGKTTILNAIAGFDTADRGAIYIGGRDVSHLAPNKRGIGMVFQRYALFPHMTVAENIGFPLRMRRVGRSEMNAQIAAALALVRLDGYGDRRIGQLSGGQQQRVALARALVYSPPLLLMDEPLGALDKNLREEMQLEIKRIQAQLGTTVIYVTHDQGEALRMANRIAVVNAGRILQFAAPDDVYHRPTDSFVASFVGETNFIDGRLVRTEDAGWTLRTDDGISFALDQTQAGPHWTEGATARLALRPEAIVPGTQAGLHGGIVEEAIFCGGTLSCTVRVSPNLTLVATLPSIGGQPVRAGDRVNLTYPPDAGRVFA
jgi:ABC-type Fe3+/spermidine/putrescine transport system ATPase subunit